MAVQLTPRNYKPGLSWKLLTKNKVDTVASEPYTNARIERQLIHSEEFTSAAVDGATVALPVSSTYVSNISNYVKNEDAQYVRAFGRVQAIGASGYFILHTEQPLADTPVVELRFEGQTSYINRGSKTISDMYSLFGNNNNISSTIEMNKDGTESWQNSKSLDTHNRGSLADPTLVDYTRPNVPLYPFVKIMRAATEGTEANWQANKPSEEEVLTHWIKDFGTLVTFPQLNNWSQKTWASAQMTWDSQKATYPTSSTVPLEDQRAAFAELYTNIYTTITKISDYDYRIYWFAPIRYAYAAASQAHYIGFLFEIDNYAFFDQITKVIVDVYATTLDHDTTVPKSYSLSNNTLTTDVINEYPISFDKNEFITLATYENSPSNLWTESMALRILQAYKDGKYVVECEVNAQWALSNNITVNSEIQVTLQNGTKITRGNDIVTFEVKTIEKIFRCNEFTYALRLLEK